MGKVPIITNLDDDAEIETIEIVERRIENLIPNSLSKEDKSNRREIMRKILTGDCSEDEVLVFY